MLLPIAFALALVAVARLSRGFACGGPVLAVLGSGGHTGEMLALLARLQLDAPLACVAGAGDALSLARARQLPVAPAFYTLPRARRVGQGRASSALSALRALLCALRLLWLLKPRLLLTNGPATGAVVALAARLLCLRTRVVYVESVARVDSLSLSGRIVYHLDLSDRFIVQWPELKRYAGVEYYGLLA